MVLINNVSRNKQEFTKRKINCAEQAETLHAKLGYKSVKDLRWIDKIQQIIEFPVMVQDIEIAYAIWGKNIADLKGNTTRKKTIHVAGENFEIPKELVKLHK